MTVTTHNFNVETQTTPADEYEFAGNQETMAKHHHVERVFRWRDLHGNAGLLPKYVKAAIEEAGFQAVCIGGTTYSHSVIGLYRVA